MGTRCLTTVHSRWDEDSAWECHAVIYRHWDGYPDEHGATLFKFLEGARVTNGVLMGDEHPKSFNGPGRLAACLVYFMQDEGHEPDLMPEVHDCGQEYHYDVRVDRNQGSVPFRNQDASIEVVVYSGPVAMGYSIWPSPRTSRSASGGDLSDDEEFRGTIEAYGEWLDGARQA